VEVNHDTDRELKQLSARAWIDSNRINRLERRLKALRIQLYVLLAFTLVFAVVITLVLARAYWHLRP